MEKEAAVTKKPRAKKINDGTKLPNGRLFQCTLVTEKKDNYVRLLRFKAPKITVQLTMEDSNHGPFQEMIDFIQKRYGKQTEVNVVISNDRTTIQQQLDSYESSSDDSPCSLIIINNSHNVDFQFNRRLKSSTLILRLKCLFEIKKPRIPLIQQDRVIEFYKQYHPRRLMFNWALGSGKTKGAVKVVGSEYERKVAVICTNTLIEMWENEVKEEAQLCDCTLFEIMGYVEFKRHVQERGMKLYVDHMIVLDEGHYFRNITPAMKRPLMALLNSKRFILLTGTAIVNGPDESAFLNILFRGNNQTVTPDQLENNVMHQMVSYHDPKNDPSLNSFFPTTSKETINIPMTWRQTLEYMMYRKSTGVLGQHKIRHGKLNSYNSTTRALSNIPYYILDDISIPNGEAPKLKAVVNMVLGNNEYPVVIYSHFKNMGVHAIKTALDEKLAEIDNDDDVNVMLLTGDTRSSDRQSIIDQYNKGKIQILLLTEAAQLGINLLASKSTNILEPHKNIQSENQTVMRVCRFKSHQKSDNKHVTIYKYISVFPQPNAIGQEEKEQLQKVFVEEWLGLDENRDGEKYQKALNSINVHKELVKEIGVEIETIDQRMEKNNKVKQAAIEPYLEAIRLASIENHGFKSMMEKKKEQKLKQQILKQERKVVREQKKLEREQKKEKRASTARKKRKRSEPMVRTRSMTRLAKRKKSHG